MRCRSVQIGLLLDQELDSVLTFCGTTNPRSRVARRFPLEQNTLAFDAPGIARERAIVPNDAVARDGDGEVVRGARAGDRARGLGGSDASSDFGIGSRLASRDLLKRTPYALLEGGAANIERKIKAEPRRLN
jgi:hypothetical protein